MIDFSQPEPRASASLSDDGLYRYKLTRLMEGSKGKATSWWWTFVVVALNPSTADAERDDPTLRKMMKFARRLTYHDIGIRLVVVNLFAFRSPSPAVLHLQADPVGSSCDTYLEDELARAGRGDARVILAYGNAPQGLGVLHRVRARFVDLLLVRHNVKPLCFGVTKHGGNPGHLLYMRDDAPTLEWDPRTRAAKAAA